LPSTGVVAERHWLPPVIGAGAVTATAWAQMGNGISLNGSTPIWSTTSPSANHQTLTVTFKTTHGAGPAISQNNQATYTAINTTVNTVTSVCNQVGRP
jgi:hypothetical protein